MTGSTTTSAAARYRRDLVDLLDADGAIRSDRVRAAFATVAREEFVPRYRQALSEPEVGHRWIDGTGDPAERDEWLRGVYADEVLVVQTRPAADIAGPDGAATSSSSMPSVMAGMLEALDVRPGTRVLEIGTGTGYNTALLCRLTEPENVVTVELDPGLAADARRILWEGGHFPTVLVGDGRGRVPGLPDDDGGRFDRIIVTASTDHIPPDWIASLAEGGTIVADLRGSLAGGITRLIKTGDDVVEGRFLGLPGAFMPLRGHGGSPHRDGETWDQPIDMINPRFGLTSTDPELLADPALRLIVQCHFGGKRLRGFLPDLESPTWSGRALDGSWFTVDTGPAVRGLRRVRQGGPQRLWDTVAAAVAAWEQLDRPAVTDLEIVARDHAALQHIQPRGESSTFRWPLPL